MLSVTAQIILVILWWIGVHYGVMQLLNKAGMTGWRAFIPVIGKLDWMQLIGKAKWKYVLLWIPLVNIFVFAGMIVDLVRSFGKHGFGDHFLAVVFAPIYLPWLAHQKNTEYKYPVLIQEREFQQAWKEAIQTNNQAQIRKLEKNRPIPRKTVIREWTEAIIFAVFAATFIRMFLIEAYTIPTPSMEGSLLVGDYLFVSKIHYGARMPFTPLQFPLVHNRLPLLRGESYSRAIEWEYRRLPAIQQIKRFDPVVFNFPAGDTVALPVNPRFARDEGIDYYSLLARYGRATLHNPNNFEIIQRPIDRRDNYIKRCIGLPGDTIEIINRDLYVNGQRAQDPKMIQHTYVVYTDGTSLNANELLSWGLDRMDIERNRAQNMTSYWTLNLNIEQIEKIEALYYVDSVRLADRFRPGTPGQGNMFPDDKVEYPWNTDFYGPLPIPAKGQTTELTLRNLPMFRRIIEVYEGNSLDIRNGRIFINNEPATHYTFKMDYYFMVGDNRSNSYDGRMWGYVPEDHIVGKPLFIWFSSKPGVGVRWNRLFTNANSH